MCGAAAAAPGAPGQRGSGSPARHGVWGHGPDVTGPAAGTQRHRARAGLGPAPGCPPCPWGHSGISLASSQCSAVPAAAQGTGPCTLQTSLHPWQKGPQIHRVSERGCPHPLYPPVPSRQGPAPFICRVTPSCWQKRLEPVEGKLESLPGPGKRK